MSLCSTRLVSCSVTRSSVIVMASVSSPLRVCRGILKEIRLAKGPGYRQAPLYLYVLQQFRKNQVTGAQVCRERREALHLARTCQCLLSSTRLHQHLHQRFHGLREHSHTRTAELLGFRLPTPPTP
ncbi:hypothetical protein DNTS_009468 [Danionella cerebrum]|uniref:Protein FMC1 homolog n=1 Tax=Danionella cerebrum TaxID=2873325 RepID=A0A553PWU9_9TELE|nr:hypothetical protein DNTS_009468 [Danionella translucida]